MVLVALAQSVVEEGRDERQYDGGGGDARRLRPGRDPPACPCLRRRCRLPHRRSLVFLSTSSAPAKERARSLNLGRKRNEADAVWPRLMASRTLVGLKSRV